MDIPSCLRPIECFILRVIGEIFTRNPATSSRSQSPSSDTQVGRLPVSSEKEIKSLQQFYKTPNCLRPLLIYYIDTSVLLGNIPCVQLIVRNYTQDPSGIFSIYALVRISKICRIPHMLSGEDIGYVISRLYRVGNSERALVYVIESKLHGG